MGIVLRGLGGCRHVPAANQQGVCGGEGGYDGRPGVIRSALRLWLRHDLVTDTDQPFLANAWDVPFDHIFVGSLLLVQEAVLFQFFENDAVMDARADRSQEMVSYSPEIGH